MERHFERQPAFQLSVWGNIEQKVQGDRFLILTLCFPLTAHISLSAWPDRHVSFYRNQDGVLDTHTLFHSLILQPVQSVMNGVFYGVLLVFGLKKQLVARTLPGKEWSHSCRILSDWLGTPDLCGQTTTTTKKRETVRQHTYILFNLIFRKGNVFFIKS